MSNAWYFVCHLDYKGKSAVTVVKSDGKTITAKKIPADAATDAPHKAVFLGVTADDRVMLMDPVSKQTRTQTTYPEDAYAPYAYRDPDGKHFWFVNDGDKDGIDPLNCTNGSSVTVIRHPGQANAGAEHIKTFCAGRGHHATAFSYPSASAPNVPYRAFVSNLKDGTISVVGNDPKDAATYLKTLDTINLCEPAREKDGKMAAPNNAFPHGIVYSPVTGRIYNHNNGYGTVAIIDPVTNKIEKLIDLPLCSNLLLSPNGRFLIGKGVDRSSNPDHVIGRLNVVDAASGEVACNLDLQDIYPSTYRFNPDGSRLYVTTASTGKGAQKDNQKKNVVLVYDTSALPRISLLREIIVGMADCGRRPIGFLEEQGKARYVFVPNPTDGTLSVVDGGTHEVLQTVSVGPGAMFELNLCFWEGKTYGC